MVLIIGTDVFNTLLVIQQIKFSEEHITRKSNYNQQYLNGVKIMKQNYNLMQACAIPKQEIFVFMIYNIDSNAIGKHIRLFW